MSWLHPNKHGQQDDGGDPAPLLCTDETSAGVLVESSVQERNGPVFFNSSGKALEQVDEIGDCPILEESGKTGSEQPDLSVDDPVHCRGVGLDDL